MRKANIPFWMYPVYVDGVKRSGMRDENGTGAGEEQDVPSISSRTQMDTRLFCYQYSYIVLNTNMIISVVFFFQLLSGAPFSGFLVTSPQCMRTR